MNKKLNLKLPIYISKIRQELYDTTCDQLRCYDDLYDTMEDSIDQITVSSLAYIDDIGQHLDDYIRDLLST